jgi:hypothetical protein
MLQSNHKKRSLGEQQALRKAKMQYDPMRPYCIFYVILRKPSSFPLKPDPHKRPSSLTLTTNPQESRPSKTLNTLSLIMTILFIGSCVLKDYAKKCTFLYTFI